MNRFNGLCKVCSERRYRQVGARPFEGRHGVSLGGGGQGWGLSLAGPLSPHGRPCLLLRLAGSF